MPARECNSKTSIGIISAYRPAYQLNVHTSCICNEYISLTNRHLVNRGQNYDRGFFLQFKKNYKKLFTGNVDPVSYWNVINDYVGGKRKVYINAYEKLKLEGFSRKLSYIKMFVKPDRYRADDIYDKCPRAIQARSPGFNLLVSRYIKPIEKWVYKNVQGFAKTLNSQQRAAKIIEHWGNWGDTIAICLDHSKFDSCVNVDYLRFTHSIYYKLTRSRFLKYLMQYTINNVGFSKNGIRYKVRGTRMSGDADTALGNSIISHFLIKVVFRRVQHELILDGDDAVVFISRKSLALLDFSEFSKLGFDTKIQVCYNIEDITFCQSKVLFTDIPIMSRDPYRAISFLNCSMKQYPEAVWAGYQQARGMCEAVMSAGVPILSVLAEVVQTGARPVFDEDTRWLYEQNKNVQKQQVTLRARESFHLNWGINAEEQILIEQRLRNPDTDDEPFPIYYHRRLYNKFKGFFEDVKIVHYADQSLHRTWEAWNALGTDSSTGCHDGCPSIV